MKMIQQIFALLVALSCMSLRQLYAEQNRPYLYCLKQSEWENENPKLFFSMERRVNKTVPGVNPSTLDIHTEWDNNWHFNKPEEEVFNAARLVCKTLYGDLPTGNPDAGRIYPIMYYPQTGGIASPTIYELLKKVTP